ncbi:MAG: tetratricopeptide repeat protein [Burkholderiaceae bacterium]|nr:tetratricopeptide repeat protein [Burkholderiaceae bacterium]
MQVRLNLQGKPILRGFLTLLCLTCLAVYPTTSRAADDSTLEQARTLMAQGNARAAYAMLEPLEFDRAGDVEFDTLLGVAALDSGSPDKATLAFERVLAVDPNAAGARLDLARAYFALGDLPRARQELDLLTANNPPPAARVVIDKYKAAIAEREKKKATTTTAYAEGFIGYDNNITSVVSDFGGAVLASYNLAGFLPTGNSVMRTSSIFGAAGGFAVDHRVDDHWSLAGGLDAHYRGVTQDDNYSSEELDARASAARSSGADTWRAGITLQDFLQRTDVPTDNRNAIGLNFEWRHTYNDYNQGSVFGVVTRQRYPDIAVDDINSTIVGAGWLHLFQGPHHGLMYANLIVGQENAINPLVNGSDNSRRDAGGRLYMQLSANDQVDWFANFGLLQRSDRSPYARAITVEYGNDHLSDATVGCTWRPYPQWSLRPQVSYSENRSNVALSDFHRLEALLTVRYEWH